MPKRQVAQEESDVATAVSLLGTLVVAMGVLGLAVPVQFIGKAVRWRVSSHLVLVVAFRAIVGIFLLLAGRYCRRGAVVQVFGALAIIGAVILAFVGRGRFERFMAGWPDHPPWHTRLLALAAVLFGGVLIWAAAWP
jgi:hypothetical protein